MYLLRGRTGSLNKRHVTCLQRVKSIIFHKMYPRFSVSEFAYGMSNGEGGCSLHVSLAKVGISSSVQ